MPAFFFGLSTGVPQGELPCARAAPAASKAPASAAFHNGDFKIGLRAKLYNCYSPAQLAPDMRRGRARVRGITQLATKPGADTAESKAVRRVDAV